MENEIDVIADDPRWEQAGLDALAQDAIGAAMARLGLGGGYEVVVLGCDDARIAVLNADFRAKPQPTNVLSWPSEDRDPDGPRPAPDALGDIAIAFDTCQKEALAQGKDFADHVRHLLVHGFLHLLGYDHETEQEAALMEALEVETLATMGIADPY